MSLHHQLPLDTCIKSFINHPAHVSTADPSLIHCRTRSSSSAHCPLLSSPYFFLSFSTLIVLSSVQWSASLVSLYQPHHLSHQCFLICLQCLFLIPLLVLAIPSTSVSSIFPSPSSSWTWLNHLLPKSPTNTHICFTFQDCIMCANNVYFNTIIVCFIKVPILTSSKFTCPIIHQELIFMDQKGAKIFYHQWCRLSTRLGSKKHSSS